MLISPDGRVVKALNMCSLCLRLLGFKPRHEHYFDPIFRMRPDPELLLRSET